MAADGPSQKIRIRLKAYDHEILDQSTEKIVQTVLRTSARGEILRLPARCGTRAIF